MDVLAQALNVVERSETASGRVAITLDLDEPGQRAAFAAAVAVLRAMDVDAETLLAPADEAPAPAEQPARDAEASRASGAVPDTDEDHEEDARLRSDFATAVAELTPDEARQAAVVRDAFPRVKELLRDGANVEAVAQIQYRRWVEEHLDSVRRN
ncbi:MAG: hypothetical protein ACRDJN_08190 [Chloroflexota bacterium]